MRAALKLVPSSKLLNSWPLVLIKPQFVNYFLWKKFRCCEICPSDFSLKHTSDFVF